MRQKVVTLSLNPAIDVTLYLPDLTAGGEYLAVPEQREAGGKGANVSRCLVRRGVEHQAVVVVGEENASRFLTPLALEGVSYHAIQVPGSVRENLTLAVPGQPITHITRQNLSLTEEMLEEVSRQLLPLLGPETLLIIGGKLPNGLSSHRFTEFFIQLRETTGAELILDTSSLSKEEMLAIRPWLVKPNWEELAALMQTTLPDLDSVKAAARELHHQGLERLLVSVGGLGSIYLGEEGEWHCTAPGVDVKSPVGAGDSLLAEFLACYLEGRPLKESLIRATAAGSASCLHYGTVAPDPEEVQQLLPQVQLAPL